jgi:phenylacetate-coenzyme A ligase PaaK-like adenylate-forming protein
VNRIEKIVLQFRDVLAETERLASDELQAYQQKLLEPLLQHARRHVPFYAQRLAPLFHGETPDLDRFHEIPILTRAQAQANVKALAARNLPPHVGPVETDETSGSTGRPFVHRRSQLLTIANLGLTDRLLRWWDFDGNKTMATFIARHPERAPPPSGTTVRGWRTGFSGLHHFIDMWADTDVQIDWLVERQPHYLTAYSSTLLALAERVQRHGVSLRFERVNSIASVLSDDIRLACREAFGVSPIDQYGAQEVGLIAGECPVCGHYHLSAEAMLTEILRDDGTLCAPGEMGRVVVTSFYNYAMPFIRYEIGDYAIAGPVKVKCPVRLPNLTRVLGRYRSTFTLTDGRIIYPYVTIGRFRDFITFEQVQVVQTDYDMIEVRYVPTRGAAADEAGLQAYLREAIDASFNVRAIAVDAIPRAASGKFEDFLSLVPRHRD